MKDQYSNVYKLTFPKPRPKRKGLAIAMAAGDGYVFIAASGRQRFDIKAINELIRDLRDVRDDAKARSKGTGEAVSLMPTSRQKLESAESAARSNAALRYWLIGYLAGKALTSAINGDIEKAKHHTISSGAVLLNWFERLSGGSEAMRPGIAEPEVDRA